MGRPELSPNRACAAKQAYDGSAHISSRDEETYTGWAALPTDVIGNLCDHANPALLRSICRSWRRAVDSTTTVLAPAVFHTEKIAKTFPSLVHLDLSNCAVTVSDDKLEKLQACTNLQTLNLKGCERLTAAGLKSLVQQTSVQTLLLGGELYSIPRHAFTENRDADDKVDDDMLRVLARFSSLKAMDAGFSSRCTRAGVMELVQLTNLQCLSISGICSHDFGVLEASDIAAFAAMPHLAVLELGVVAPSAFSALTALSPLCTSLDIHGDHWEMGVLSQNELNHLSSLTNLVHLGIYHYEIVFQRQDDLGPEAASAMLFLEHLKKMLWFQLTCCIIPQGSDLAILARCAHVPRVQLWLMTEPEVEAEGIGHELEFDQPSPGKRPAPELPPLNVTELSVRLHDGEQQRMTEWLSKATGLSQLQWECMTDQSSDGTNQPLSRSSFTGWRAQSGIFELDMGASMILQPNALTAVARFSLLSHLTCHVQGSLPGAVADLTSLEGLHISWDSNMDDGMELIGRLHNLRELHCGCEEPGTDASLHALRQAIDLTELVFHPQTPGPSISGRGLESVAMLTSLRRLDLIAGTTLEEQELGHLAPLTWLQHLELGCCATISDTTIEMLQPLRRLRRVWLRLDRQVMWIHKTNAVQVTPTAVASLAETHPELSFVCFGNAQMQSFPHVAIDHCSLQRLALAASRGQLDAADESLVWMP